MTTYKVIYFNGRGRAETIRMVLSQAGVDFEDCRLDREEWARLNQRTPTGKLPVLETAGHMLAESTAISRFLARRFGLMGDDEFEAAKCDMLVCAMDEVAAKFSQWFMERDPEKKQALHEQVMKDHALPFAQKMEGILLENESGLLVGKNITWADLHLFNFADRLPSSCPRDTVPSPIQMPEETTTDFPQLAAFKKRIAQLPKIKAWIDSRPKTPF